MYQFLLAQTQSEIIQDKLNIIKDYKGDVARRWHSILDKKNIKKIAEYNYEIEYEIKVTIKNNIINKQNSYECMSFFCLCKPSNKITNYGNKLGNRKISIFISPWKISNGYLNYLNVLKDKWEKKSDYAQMQNIQEEINIINKIKELHPDKFIYITPGNNITNLKNLSNIRDSIKTFIKANNQARKRNLVLQAQSKKDKTDYINMNIAYNNFSNNYYNQNDLLTHNTDISNNNNNNNNNNNTYINILSNFGKIDYKKLLSCEIM